MLIVHKCFVQVKNESPGLNIARENNFYFAVYDNCPRGSHDRMTEDRNKWRKYVHRVANPRIDRGRLKNRGPIKKISYDNLTIILR